MAIPCKIIIIIIFLFNFLDISIFSPLFQNCVKKMTDILYRLQHHQNGNGIYDPEDFLLLFPIYFVYILTTESDQNYVDNFLLLN